jgi:NADH-ubiquinone oxidoreductase chain 4L
MIFILTALPIIAIVALLIQHSHLLITLLTLEGLTLSLVLLIPLLLTHSTINLNTLRIVILCLGACEARLGLSLLVLLSRGLGSDLVKSLSINKC